MTPKCILPSLQSSLCHNSRLIRPLKSYTVCHNKKFKCPSCGLHAGIQWVTSILCEIMHSYPIHASYNYSLVNQNAYHPHILYMDLHPVTSPSRGRGTWYTYNLLRFLLESLSYTAYRYGHNYLSKQSSLSVVSKIIGIS